MNKVDLWQFLEEKQRAAVMKEVERIRKKAYFPVPFTLILKEMDSSNVADVIQDIDPKLITLKQKLMQANSEAMAGLFQQISDALTEMVDRTVDQFEQEKTLKYLSKNYLKLVNGCCRTEYFQWRVLPSKNRSLWRCLTTEVSRLLKCTLSFMKKTYEIPNFVTEPHLDRAMKRFLMKLKRVQNRLEQIFRLSQSTAESLMSMGKEERKIIDNNETEISKMISKIELMQMNIEEKGENREEDCKEETEKEKSSSMLSRLKDKGMKLLRHIAKVPEILDGDTEPCKKLEDCQLYSSNISNSFELNKEQSNIAQRLIFIKQSQLEKAISGNFTEEELLTIEYSTKMPIFQWEETEVVLSGEKMLPKLNKNKLYCWKDLLIKAVKRISSGKRKNQQRFFILAATFYRQLQKQYCPFAKRYLGKVCEAIQKLFQPVCPYLRGALKIYETNSIKPSKLAKQLQQSKPFRSPSFQQSEKSMIYRQSYSSKNQPTKRQFSQQNERIKFQRLTYNQKPCKNVIFLVSGFLSEDTEKDLQWLGAIRALEQSEMYGVIWPSSTASDLAKYIAKKAGSLALTMPTGNFGTFLGVAQIGVQLANTFIEGDKKKKEDNPFWESLSRADEAGKELADLLIKHFSDRFLTLIGFSMGTEVIMACIQRLAQCKQLHLVLRVATFGGVANREKIHKMVTQFQEPLSWINFKSKRDYAVRFVYRVCTLGSQPIGAGGVRKVDGHEIQNWELQELVGGHMDFRSHLYGLCLLSGFKHD